MGAAIQPGLPDRLDQIVDLRRPFGDQDRRRTGGQADGQGQIPSIAPHDLHDRAALMGLHRITQAVNAGDGRIGRSIEADAIAGTGNIIIDRRRDADDIDAEFRQRPGPTERAVAADGDHAVQPEEFAVVIRLLLPCRGAEFLAAGCIEHRAAPVDDMRDGQRVHPLDIPVDQAAPAPPDADALEPPVACRSGRQRELPHSSPARRRRWSKRRSV